MARYTQNSSVCSGAETTLGHNYYYYYYFFHLTYSRWTIITILPVVTKVLPISPRFTPYNFLSRCKFSTLTTRRPIMVEFYLLTFPRFPLRKKEHKSFFKNRTHDFRTSRCAAYLLDHSGDELLYSQGGYRHTTTLNRCSIVQYGEDSLASICLPPLRCQPPHACAVCQPSPNRFVFTVRRRRSKEGKDKSPAEEGGPPIAVSLHDIHFFALRCTGQSTQNANIDRSLVYNRKSIEDIGPKI